MKRLLAFKTPLRITHTREPLPPFCVFIKRSLSHFSLSSAVLPFANSSGVIANWRALGEYLPPRRRRLLNKLERERERSRGGKEEHGEKAEKEEKTGGRS